MKFRLFLHFIQLVVNLLDILQIDKESKLGKKYEDKKNKSKFYKNANFHSVMEIQKKIEKAGFSNIECTQALLPGDTHENYKPEVKQGYGEGSFVVLRGQKKDV